MEVTDFDQLAVTPAISDALGALREATGRVDGPMERHCLRVRHIAVELASQRAWPTDSEVITVAAILHDIGLYPGASRGGVYTADGAEVARELLYSRAWSDERIRRCTEAIDRHHELRRQLLRGSEVEALRLADRVDLGGGLLSLGLDRRWLSGLNQAVPRRGLIGELTRELSRAFRQRPLTMPRIFWRP